MAVYNAPHTPPAAMRLANPLCQPPGAAAGADMRIQLPAAEEAFPPAADMRLNRRLMRTLPAGYALGYRF